MALICGKYADNTLYKNILFSTNYSKIQYDGVYRTIDFVHNGLGNGFIGSKHHRRRCLFHGTVFQRPAGKSVRSRSRTIVVDTRIIGVNTNSNDLQSQLTAAIFYPIALALGAEALVSITRVEELLLLEERDGEEPNDPIKSAEEKPLLKPNGNGAIPKKRLSGLGKFLSSLSSFFPSQYCKIIL